MLDGTMTVAEELAHFFLAPMTPAQATQLRRAAQRAKKVAQAGDTRGAIKELRRANPKVAEIVEREAQDRSWQRSDVIALIGMLIAALTFLQPYFSQGQELTEEDVVRIVEEARRQAGLDPVAAPPEEPQPGSPGPTELGPLDVDPPGRQPGSSAPAQR